jgi:hypothetical protein
VSGRAAPTNLLKSSRTVEELTSVGLLAPQSNFLAQFIKSKPFQVLTFLQKPQALADDFALRLVKA